MPDLARPLLIAITDRRMFQMSPENWACEAIAGGVDLIQVREKDLNESGLLEFAARIFNCVIGNETRGSDPGLKTEEPFQGSTPVLSPGGTSACQHGHFSALIFGGTRIQINNSTNIARLLDCGLHLPESAPVPSKPRHPLSRSVHSTESALESKGVDFLIAGHIFATPTKSESEPRGLDWLESVAGAVEIPVVAIGGITVKNAGSCIQHGASGIAVISAIAASSDPRNAAKLLRMELDRAWSQKHG